MTMLRWHLDVIGEYGLRLEYDPTRELWLASAEVEDSDEDNDDERVAFDLPDLLSAIADEPPDSPWIIALADQIEADRRVRSRARYPWW
jgi:hypothetical protein